MSTRVDKLTFKHHRAVIGLRSDWKKDAKRAAKNGEFFLKSRSGPTNSRISTPKPS
jgi:hypothetical protein